MTKAAPRLTKIQAKALDKRTKSDGEAVYDLAEIFLDKEYFDLAVNAYDYLILKGKRNPFFVEANINKNSLKNLKARGVAACSGSAGGFACSKYGILQLLRTAEQTVKDPGIILNPTNDLLSDQISKNFNDLAEVRF